MDAVAYWKKIGSLLEEADPDGSILARLKDIKDTVFPWHKKTMTWTKGLFEKTIDASSTVEVISISGDKLILYGHIYVKDDTPDLQLKIIIDGETVFLEWMEDLCSVSDDAAHAATLKPLGLASSERYIQFFNLHFETSFVVQFQNTSTGRTGRAYYSFQHVPV